MALYFSKKYPQLTIPYKKPGKCPMCGNSNYLRANSNITFGNHHYKTEDPEEIAFLDARVGEYFKKVDEPQKVEPRQTLVEGFRDTETTGKPAVGRKPGKLG